MSDSNYMVSACTMRLESEPQKRCFFFFNYLYRHVGFVAGMVAKYALLCTFVEGGRSYWLLGKVRIPSNQYALGRVYK